MSAGDIDWSNWTDAYGWRVPFVSTNTIPNPYVEVVSSEPGSVTYCHRHPTEKIAEFTTTSGWMGICKLCSAEDAARRLLGL